MRQCCKSFFTCMGSHWSRCSGILNLLTHLGTSHQQALVLSDGGRHDSGEPFERHHSRGSQLKFKSRNDAREIFFIRNCPDLVLSRSPQEDKSLLSRSFVFQKLCVFFQVDYGAPGDGSTRLASVCYSCVRSLFRLRENVTYAFQ